MSILTVRNVGKQYGDRWVVRGIHFELSPGDRLAVLGPSGCGKTTLLNLIGGLDSPDEGTVELEGRVLMDLTPEERAKIRRERIGTIFQFFHLIPTLTAFENIQLPLELLGWSSQESKVRVGSLLEDVGLTHRASAWPYELSGGEQQRVAVARALASKPALLLADEPTGNLDQTSGLKVLNLLSTLSAKENTALIMVTHSEIAAKNCPRVLSLIDDSLVTQKAP